MVCYCDFCSCTGSMAASASSASSSSAPTEEPKKFGPVAKPVLTGPHAVSLDSGAKYVCACGQSANYPFCDGTHSKVNADKGTNFAPVKFSKEETGKSTVYICSCGKSGNRPFCDGSHSK